MGQLDGHRAIVTGGASGIGAAIVRHFVAEGARVAIFDIDGAAAAALAAEVDALAFEVNVARTEPMADAVALAAEAMGGLTDLCNNAGVGRLKALHDYSEKEWDRLIDVNLKGPFNGIRAAVPILLAGHERTGVVGSIVNMASVSGLRATFGEAPYSAAKAGVISLTQAAALEYGPALRVNCVSPGFIHTRLTDFAVSDDALRGPVEAATPLGRVGLADEIACVVSFLCSDAASYVTGQNLVVDGGSMLPGAQTDPLLRGLLGRGDPS